MIIYINQIKTKLYSKIAVLLIAILITSLFFQTAKTQNSEAESVFQNGVSAYNSGNISDAVSLWEYSLKLDPTNKKTKSALIYGFIILSKSQARAGKFEEALATIKKALTYSPGNTVLTSLDNNVKEAFALSLESDTGEPPEEYKKLFDAREERTKLQAIIAPPKPKPEPPKPQEKPKPVVKKEPPKTEVKQEIPVMKEEEEKKEESVKTEAPEQKTVETPQEKLEEVQKVEEKPEQTQEQKTTQIPTPVQTPQKEEKQQLNIPMIAGGAGGIIIVAIILTVVFTRKKVKPQKEDKVTPKVEQKVKTEEKVAKIPSEQQQIYEKPSEIAPSVGPQKQPSTMPGKTQVFVPDTVPLHYELDESAAPAPETPGPHLEIERTSVPQEPAISDRVREKMLEIDKTVIMKPKIPEGQKIEIEKPVERIVEKRVVEEPVIPQAKTTQATTPVTPQVSQFKQQISAVTPPEIKQVKPPEVSESISSIIRDIVKEDLFVNITGDISTVQRIFTLDPEIGIISLFDMLKLGDSSIKEQAISTLLDCMLSNSLISNIRLLNFFLNNIDIADKRTVVSYIFERVKANPTNSKTMFIRGMIYLSINAYDQALNSFLETIKLDSTNVDAYVAGGIAQIKAGNYENAVSLLSKVEVKLKDSRYPPLLSGLLFAKKEQLKDAIEAWKKEVEFNSEQASKLVKLGHLAHTQNLFLEAISHYKKAIESDPKNDQIFSLLGKAYIAKNMKEEARICSRHAFILNPNSEVIQNDLGMALFVFGNKEGARKIWTTLAEKSKQPNIVENAKANLKRIT